MFTLDPQKERQIRRLYGGKLPVAFAEDKKLIKPTKGLHGICPECGQEVISKTFKLDKEGKPVKRNHFAHLKDHSCCTTEQRSEGLWHLRQKAVFPVDWCEIPIPKETPEGKKYRFTDVCSYSSKYIIDFESSLEGRQVQERDQFYADCNVRSSWVFQASLDKTIKKLDIISLTNKTLDVFKARQQDRIFYQRLIDSRWPCVLIQGDLPLSQHTTLTGMPFLNLSNKAYLVIAPDRRERFEIDISQEWALGIIYSPGDLMGTYRPSFRTDAQLGDESAIRMQEYVNTAGEALKKAGGPLKLLKVDTSRKVSFRYASPKSESVDGEHTDQSGIDITPEEVVQAYHAETLGSILDCNFDELEKARAFYRHFSEMKARAKQQQIENEGLEEYKRGNVESISIDFSAFESTDPSDHSILWDMERGMYDSQLSQALEKAVTVSKQKVEKIESFLKEQEEKNRLEEERKRQEVIQEQERRERIRRAREETERRRQREEEKRQREAEELRGKEEELRGKEEEQELKRLQSISPQALEAEIKRAEQSPLSSPEKKLAEAYTPIAKLEPEEPEDFSDEILERLNQGKQYLAQTNISSETQQTLLRKLQELLKSTTYPTSTYHMWIYTDVKKYE